MSMGILNLDERTYFLDIVCAYLIIASSLLSSLLYSRYRA